VRRETRRASECFISAIIVLLLTRKKIKRSPGLSRQRNSIDRNSGSLGGIVTNHAIVLFERATREMEAGEPMERALILAGTTRLRPILPTVTASLREPAGAVS
jgi:hypothetical protein